VKRLFLNRVHRKATGATIGREHNSIVFAGPHEAQAALPFVELARTRTKLTDDPPVVELAPILR
jgi:hypothetical protein